MGLLTALSKRYVRCGADVDDVDLRAFAVGVTICARSLAVNNQQFPRAPE